jgi:protein-L-isoaspartate(D-aspartate) O-methyltransferase
MAWTSSGRSNSELIRNMHRSGLIRSDKVLKAFLSVDRGHFVPKEKRDLAYLDEPVHSAPFHLSAPHMYATVLEALDLQEGQSFLNIGSGSGYLSFLVASIVGPAINHGIEQHRELVEHAMSRCAQVPEFRNINHIRFTHGDAFLLKTQGQKQHYDRIYVGAGVHVSATLAFRELLSIGGMMVAPREDELICITRVSEDVFVSRVITNVRFQPLVEPDPKAAKLMNKMDLSEPSEERVSFCPSNGITVAKIVKV